jgi:lipopolysaccharide export system ATP-binding protein
MPLLEVAHIHQHSGKKQLLIDVSFQAQADSVVALLGPNGAGKTTLLRTVIGLLATKHLAAGSIFFNGQDITHASVAERVCAGLLYLPQHTSLLTQLSVKDNLEIVHQYHPWWQGKPIRQFHDEMHHWLALTTLTATLPQGAGTLSGGQKRKLEVVRSLLMKPKMLLLDEPFAGVDPKSIYELKTLFLTLNAQEVGIVISDHHVDQLLSMAQQVYVLAQGSVVASGGIQAILENSYTKERYFGAELHQAMTARFSSDS